MVRTIKTPPGIAKPNWWIFKELARKMGHDWESNSGRDICDKELAVLCPMFAGIIFDRLEHDGLQWPCPNVEHPGTPIVHRDGNFTHGKGILKGLEWTPPEEVADKGYPLVLSTGRGDPPTTISKFVSSACLTAFVSMVTSLCLGICRIYTPQAGRIIDPDQRTGVLPIQCAQPEPWPPQHCCRVNSVRLRAVNSLTFPMALTALA